MSKAQPTHHDVMALNRMACQAAADTGEVALHMVFGLETNWSPDTGDARRRYVFRDGSNKIGPREATEHLLSQLTILGVPQRRVDRIFW